MTSRKIIVKPNQQSDKAGTDFATLAEQLIQDSWHLPPEGDQSWREQDARRIFHDDGEGDINHTDELPPAMEEAPEEIAEEEPRLEPGFRASRMVGVLLPLSLATFVACFAVVLSVPEILTAGFWRGAEPKAAPVVQVSAANAAPLVAARPQREAAPGDLRPSLAANHASEPVRHANAAATSKSNHRAPLAVARADAAKPGAQPLHAAPKAGGHDRQKPVVQVAKAETPRETPSRKRAATRLPPIGEAYFASHTRVAADTTDWKTEAARWDEKAAEIRAKREKNGDIALATSPAQNASEFP